MDISTFSNIKNIDDEKTKVYFEIDKKIKLKFLKEKRTTRTYISGLEHFFTAEEIEKLTNSLKKKLATGIIKKNKEDSENEFEYGFNGDHINRIKNILINDLNIESDKINV